MNSTEFYNGKEVRVLITTKIVQNRKIIQITSTLRLLLLLRTFFSCDSIPSVSMTQDTAAPRKRIKA